MKLVLAPPDPAAAPVMNMTDLRKAQTEVMMITVTDESIDAFIQIRDACKGEGIVAWTAAGRSRSSVTTRRATSVTMMRGSGSVAAPQATSID